MDVALLRVEVSMLEDTFGDGLSLEVAVFVFLVPCGVKPPLVDAALVLSFAFLFVPVAFCVVAVVVFFFVSDAVVVLRPFFASLSFLAHSFLRLLSRLERWVGTVNSPAWTAS